MSDVDHYIKPRANPLAKALWLAAGIGLPLLLGFQIKHFFVERYAQHDTYRGYLTHFCKVVGCRLPPRRSLADLNLTRIQVDLHPQVPGALRVTVNLVNKATFTQPYPDLRLTLTDRSGRVVGRRTFLPDHYLEQGQDDMLTAGMEGVVLLNLAHPHEKAVGFDVEIMAQR